MFDPWSGKIQHAAGQLARPPQPESSPRSNEVPVRPKINITTKTIVAGDEIKVHVYNASAETMSLKKSTFGMEIKGEMKQ